MHDNVKHYLIDIFIAIVIIISRKIHVTPTYGLGLLPQILPKKAILNTCQLNNGNNFIECYFVKLLDFKGDIECLYAISVGL